MRIHPFYWLSFFVFVCRVIDDFAFFSWLPMCWETKRRWTSPNTSSKTLRWCESGSFLSSTTHEVELPTTCRKTLTAVRFSPFFYRLNHFPVGSRSHFPFDQFAVLNYWARNPFLIACGPQSMFRLINLNPYSSAIIQLTRIFGFFRLSRVFRSVCVFGLIELPPPPPTSNRPKKWKTCLVVESVIVLTEKPWIPA